MPILFPIYSDLPAGFVGQMHRNGATVRARLCTSQGGGFPDDFFQVQSNVPWSSIAPILPGGGFWQMINPFTITSNLWVVGLQPNGVPYASITVSIGVPLQLQDFMVQFHPKVLLTREVPGDGAGELVVAFREIAPTFDQDGNLQTEWRFLFSNEGVPTSPY